jgi:flavin-binding protein dodecin
LSIAGSGSCYRRHCNANDRRVMETRGHIEEGKVAHWQVTLKVGFRLED